MAEASCSTAAPSQSTVEKVLQAEWLKPLTAKKSGNDPKTGRHLVGGRWVQVVYVIIDIFCVLVNGVLAYVLRFPSVGQYHLSISWSFPLIEHQAVARYLGFLFLYASLILLSCQWQALYQTPRTRSAVMESQAVLKAVSLATLLLAAFIYLSGVKIVSRLVVLLSLLLNAVFLAAWRYAKRRIVINRVERGIGTRNVLIVGAGKIGQLLARQIEENKLLGYRFRGFLDENHSADPHMLGKLQDLSRIARAEFIDEVFITIPSERELVKRIALEAQRYRLCVKVVPELYDGLGWHAPIHNVGDFPVMELHWQTLPALGLFVKRALDVILSFLGLLICLPFLTALGIWIKLDSEGPILYRSRRVGKKGRIFTCYKLRTMVTNADELKDSLRHRNEREGPFFKINDDPRVTRSGKILRKYSLDELPQLWNVLKGEMSLVGPRPHPLDDYQKYDLDHLRRLDVKPGMTGLWQITSRRDPSFETNMTLDLNYIDNWNIGTDLKILARTIPEVFRASGS